MRQNVINLVIYIIIRYVYMKAASKHITCAKKLELSQKVEFARLLRFANYDVSLFTPLKGEEMVEWKCVGSPLRHILSNDQVIVSALTCLFPNRKLIREAFDIGLILRALLGVVRVFLMLQII